MQLCLDPTRRECGHLQARTTAFATSKLGAHHLARQTTARQVVAALANSMQHQPAQTASDTFSSNGTSSSRCIERSTDGQHMRSAASLLERSAAAPKPAIPPESMEASSSGSSGSTNAVAASRQIRKSRTGSRNSSSMGHDVQFGSWSMVRHVAVLTTAAQEAAAADMSALMEAEVEDDGVTPKFRSSGIDINDSTATMSNSSGTGRTLTESGHQLMLIITQQSTWQDLAKLVESQAAHFTAKHCAAALHCLTALWRQQCRLAAHQQQHAMRAELRLQQPAVLQLATVLLRGMAQQMEGATGRDMADAVCAAARLALSLPPPPDSAAAATALVTPQHSARSSISSSNSTSSADAERLSGFVGALMQRSQVLMRAGQFRALPLSRVLWGFASAGFHPSRDWWAVALEATAAQLQDTQVLLQPQHQAAGMDRQPEQHPSYSYNAESVARIGWSIAKLNAPAPAAWWQCYSAATRQLLPQMDPQQLSCCLWALATVRQVPNASWMEAFYAASGSQLSDFTPQGLSVTLWALAVLQQQPPQQWQEQYDTAAIGQLPRYSMLHLSKTFWAAACISKAAMVTSSSSSGSLPPAMQQQCADGAASHRCPRFPSSAWLDPAWTQLSMVESDATPQGVACILWALVQLRMALPEQRMVQLERLAAEVWREAEPQGLAMIVWGLGVLRGPVANRFIVKRLPRHCMHNRELLMEQLSAQGLLMLLHGLAKFKAYQPGAFKQQLLAAVQLRLDNGLQLSPSEQQQSGQEGLPLLVTQAGSSNSSSSSSSSRQAWRPSELPVILLSLTQLKVLLPTPLLRQCESLLLPHLNSLTVAELSMCLFALGSARHNPVDGFVDNALVQLDAHVAQCGPKDVAQVLYGLAAMGGCADMLAAQQQQLRIERLLARAQQVIPEMDHSCLAMTMWAIARLSFRPSEALLQTCLTATTAALPGMTLVSITSILAALQSLHYLPPLPWMVETCNAARTIYHTDKTCRVWQRRASLRRLEETIGWFNAMVQQQAEAAAGAAAGDGVGGQEGDRNRGQGQGRGVLAGTTGSEAMIAAAVGVAAAVAQQWRW